MLNAAHRREGGFTVLELMLALVAVAVLAAVALPSYVDQIRRSRRADAIAAISRVQQMQERYRADREAYGDRFVVRSGAVAAVGAAGDPGATPSHATPDGHYTLRIIDAGPAGYTVVATAAGSQRADATCVRMLATLDGGNVVLDAGPSAGATHGTTSAAARRCWNR